MVHDQADSSAGFGSDFTRLKRYKELLARGRDPAGEEGQMGSIILRDGRLPKRQVPSLGPLSLTSLKRAASAPTSLFVTDDGQRDETQPHRNRAKSTSSGRLAKSCPSCGCCPGCGRVSQSSSPKRRPPSVDCGGATSKSLPPLTDDGIRSWLLKQPHKHDATYSSIARHLGVAKMESSGVSQGMTFRSDGIYILPPWRFD